MLQIALLADEFEIPERARVEAFDLELHFVFVGGFGVGEQFFDRMDRHHALGRKLRIGIEIFVVRVEGDRHHVGAEPHQLDLLLDACAGDAELHHRRAADRIASFSFFHPSWFMRDTCRPSACIDFFEGTNAVDVGDGRAGLDAVEILLSHPFDVLLRRTQMIDRIGGP